MVLLLVGAWLLWHVRKFRLGALVAFAMLSALGIYINAVHLNYGNGPVIWLAPLLGWCLYGGLAFFARKQFMAHGPRRSEEHTSELQSLMRISYAVFCLKKTNTTSTTHI